jgi:magnesium transporter
MEGDTNKLIKQLQSAIEAVIKRETTEGERLWKQLLNMHPADIAHFFSLIDREYVKELFCDLADEQRLEVFGELSDSMKVFVLSFLNDRDKEAILSKTPIDELTDLFDTLSDEELKKYLTLLSTQDRQKVLSLMKFDPESAGGIMDTDVLTLMQNFTVEKSIQILQRLQPRRDLHQLIYVTDQDNKLVGHIRLEDLVLKAPKERLFSFLRKNDLVVGADEDREQVAKKMIHYKLMTVPVVGEHDYFLGVISSDTLVDVIEQEASEDVYRISAMPAIKYPYFETSFLRILYERSYILIVLLLAQSLSTMIIKRYEATLTGFLMYFITMLISTGGNSSSQTSAVVIQGMASGDITPGNIFKFLKRELVMALSISAILGVFSFIRVYLTYGQLIGSIAVSLSLSIIVMVSVLLGSGIPLLLKKINMDPAYAAGPFLATLMDILGLLIYCYISNLILFR